MAVEKEPHILLLGGGYTLQRLARRLTPSSFVITSRDPRTCEAWRAGGLNAHQVSLDVPESIAGVFAKYPHLRIVVDSVPPLRGDADPTQGVKNVCRVIEKREGTRVIYLSTTGVFGVRDGSIVTEQTPAAPWNAQGEARWMSEQVYRAHGIPMTVLRLPAIYGPDRGVLFSIRNGSYRLVGDGSTWTNRIHVDDLVECLARAIEHPSLPPVLCVTDDLPARARDVVEYVCSREGLPIPSSVSEEEVLRAGAFTMLSNQRVQNDLMKQVLGMMLRYPSFREGLYSGEPSGA